MHRFEYKVKALFEAVRTMPQLHGVQRFAPNRPIPQLGLYGWSLLVSATSARYRQGVQSAVT